MKLEYKISEKAQADLLKAGNQDYSKTYRTVEFQPSDLTPEAREAWAEMFGTDTKAELRAFEVYGGNIYDDGSVSSDKPYIATSMNWIEQDSILTPETASDAILAMLPQYRDVQAELKAHTPKWKKALAEYQKRKVAAEVERQKREAEEKATEEARQKRIAALSWVQQLTAKLAVQSEVNAEIQRFCEKFGLQPEDLDTQDISDKPYVRITATVPIKIGDRDRTLEITNKTYHDIGEDQNEWEPAEFSDFCQAIAQTLAEIFNGEVKTATDYDRGYAYLNVQVGGDTIAVATANLKRVQW